MKQQKEIAEQLARIGPVMIDMGHLCKAISRLILADLAPPPAPAVIAIDEDLSIDTIGNFVKAADEGETFSLTVRSRIRWIAGAKVFETVLGPGAYTASNEVMGEDPAPGEKKTAYAPAAALLVVGST